MGRDVRKAVIWVGLALLPVALCAQSDVGGAGNQTDWPGWRNDGSGVSVETDIPLSWGPEEHIRWKTAIPGIGYSSPIISEGRVFVTTATPHISSAPEWSERWNGELLFRLAVFALCLVVLGAGGGVPVGKKLLLVAGFLAVTWGSLALLRWLGSAYPDVPILKGSVQWDAAVAVADGFPVQKLLWGMAGALGGVCLWFSGWIGARRDGDAETGAMSIERLNGLLLAVATGVFAGLALLAVCMIAPPRPYGWITESWTHNAAICAAGLLAWVGALSMRGRWGAIGGVGALVLLGLLLKGPPLDPVAWLGQWDRERYLLYYAAITVGILWFAGWGWWKGGAGRVGTMPVWTGVLALLLTASVFSLEFVGENQFRRGVVAVDRENGEILWHTVCATDREPLALHWANSAATPTAVTDGRRVYADFGDAGTCALELSGEIAWRSVHRQEPLHWGPASSPVLWDGLLILSRDGDEQGYTVALDVDTGEERWRADRGNMELKRFKTQDGYSTPIVVEDPGGEQLVHYSSRQVNAYDPATGELLWSVKPEVNGFEGMEFAEQIVPSPVAAGGVVVFGGSCYQPKHISALRLQEDGGTAVAALAWEDNRGAPGCSSPVIVGGLVFSVTNVGIASCRDLQTGETLKRLRLEPGDYHAATVAAGGVVFMTSNGGMTTVLGADAEMRKIGVNRLDEEVRGSLAISRGEIFIRGVEYLYCVGRSGGRN